MQDKVAQNIQILRARAERYRQLANDLLDARTSEEAASLAQELDAEIERLESVAAELSVIPVPRSHYY